MGGRVLWEHKIVCSNHKAPTGFLEIGKNTCGLRMVLNNNPLESLEIYSMTLKNKIKFLKLQ